MSHPTRPHKYILSDGNLFDVMQVCDGGANTRYFIRGVDEKTAKMIVDNDQSTQLYKQEYREWQKGHHKMHFRYREPMITADQFRSGLMTLNSPFY